MGKEKNTPSLVQEFRHLEVMICDAVDQIHLSDFVNGTDPAAVREAGEVLMSCDAIITAISEYAKHPTLENLQAFMEARGYRFEVQMAERCAYEEASAVQGKSAEAVSDATDASVRGECGLVIACAFAHLCCGCDIQTIAKSGVGTEAIVESRLERFARWPAGMQKSALDQAQAIAEQQIHQRDRFSEQLMN
jgi:hypothetical protein